DGTSSYVQTAEFTRTAIVDKVTGKILGYDTDNDGKVDTESADRAWTPTEKTLEAVKSADPSSVGYDKVDKSTVESLVVTPGQKDTTATVTYSNNQVSGTIKYIDDTTGVELDSDTLPTGKVGSKINYTTEDKIKSYEKQGYELVSSDFTDGSQVYEKEGNDFVVKLKHKTQTITPNDPNPVTPGEPINPDDPNSPVYGEETDQKNLVKDASQTIHYVGAGDDTPADNVVTQKDAFTRTVTIDKVTGKILSITPWSTKTFNTVNTPVIDGYHADKKAAGGLTATVDNPDVEETVTYAPNGKLVPVDPNGNLIPGADTPTYPTDPNDPTKVVPNEPIPDVPNWTPVDPRPVTPSNPGDDTPVPYKQVVSGTIKYVDETTGKTLSSEDLPEGTVGSKINYTTGDKIKSYEDQGYELVSSDFTDGSQVYEKEGNDFVVKLKHKTQTITPNDPNPVTPGQPINPNDPDSPVYPTDIDRGNLVKDASQTIHYVGAGDGTPADNVVPQKDAFTRTVTIDKVTGKVLSYTDWTGEKTFNTVDTPVVDGYHADKKVAGGLTATVDNPDVKETVTYAPNGKLVPVDPNGTPIPGADTPTYPTDPKDPTKVVPNEPIPDVPNWTPVDPSLVTPSNPGENTPVPYTKDETPEVKYGLTEKFVDEDGNELLPSESKGTDYKTGDSYDVTKDAKVITGYVLVKTTDTTGTFTDGDKTAVFTYKKIGKIIPVDPNGNPIPGADTPSYQNDPNDPSKVIPKETTPTVPGYTPSTPSVTPEDPTKNTPVQYTQNQYGLTEKFVDEGGNDVAPSETKGTDYKTGDSYDVTKDAKVITGYVLVKTTGTTGTFTDGDKTAVFTYKKVGKIVPVDPNGNPIPGADTPSYQNDPNDPSKVVPNEPIPDVPNWTPVDPSLVTPSNPGEDTPVPYTKDETPEVKYGLTEKFVDEDGNELSPSVNKDNSYKSGDGFDVTGDAKVINGYVLVKQDNTKGTFGNGDETATFIYKKIGKIIPVDPNGTPIPGADTPIYQNDPDDPTKVMPNEPTPEVPGYTPSTPSMTPEDPTKDTPVPYTQNQYGLTEKFVDEDGNELSPSVNKGSSYKNGEGFDVTDDAKVINGYVLVKQDNTKGTFGNGDETATFIYKKIGKIIPVDPNGNPIPGADTPIYQNDPDDPTKVVPNERIPEVPGYTPVDPSPITPADPTVDTPVPYTKNETPTTPDTPSTPTTPDQPNDSIVPNDSKHLATSTPRNQSISTVPGDSTQRATVSNSVTAERSAAVGSEKEATLPQTGNDETQAKAAMGLGLTSLGTMMAMFGLKKRRHN
ncbi:mucin-binding protein, partial [Limosilactobacillus mucosae]